MSIYSPILRPSTRCWTNLSHIRFSQRCSTHHIRLYATHPEGVNLNNPTSHLSQSLDTKHHRSSVRPDTVGPFQLGISQQALRSGEKVKKWSELSTGGKGTSNIMLWSQPERPFNLLGFLLSCENGYANEKLDRYPHWRGARDFVDLHYYFRDVLEQFADQSFQGCLRAHPK